MIGKRLLNVVGQALCAALLATMIPNLIWSVSAGKLTLLSLVWHAGIIINAVLVLLTANRVFPRHRETMQIASVILTLLVVVITGISNPQVALFTSAQ